MPTQTVNSQWFKDWWAEPHPVVDEVSRRRMCAYYFGMRWRDASLTAQFGTDLAGLVARFGGPAAVPVAAGHRTMALAGVVAVAVNMGLGAEDIRFTALDA